MAMETKLSLDDETISQLQELIQVNLDSAKGFREAADLIDDGLLQGKLLEIANSRDEQARMLQEYVSVNHEKPQREGSYSAALHRAWMNARAKFSSNDTYAVLAEAERGEDSIKAAYEDALKKHPGTAMNDVLLDQYEHVKIDYDVIRDLRDAMKS